LRIGEKRIVLPRNPAGALYAPGTPRSKTRLSLVSMKKNQITDDYVWRQKHAAALPVRERPTGLPEAIEGIKFVSASMGPVTAAIYGKFSVAAGDLVGIFEGTEEGLVASREFDFSKWVHNRKALWLYTAQADTDTLYVVASSPGYAREVGGKTGYLAALDIKTGKQLWQAGPRVANCNSIVVGKDSIFCGYGFTDEPDYLFVLDKKTGRTVQRLRVKSAPEYLAQEEDHLYVRCYDTDYIFKVR
jgi:outer membrane protein assembly factor BamB